MSFTARSFNILAQGFTQPFAYYAPPDALAWSARRERIVALLTAGEPGLLALQEVQSTSRGWGRLTSGVDGDDHAQWLRLRLAKHGYEGVYRVNDDDAGSSSSEPKNDAPNDPSAAKSLRTWPVEAGPVGARIGARIGNALFWKTSTFELVCTREVSFSTHMGRTTRDKGLKSAYMLLRGWSGAVCAVLKHIASGSLLCVCSTHLPTPGGGDSDDGPGGSGSAPREAPKGEVQQLQYAEALCTEVSAMLSALGIRDSTPVVIMGDFNAQPGSPAHTLFTQGCVPPETPALHPTSTAPGKRSRGAGEGDAPAPAAPPPVEITLPYPIPTCGGLGRFTSAYAAASGGSEPQFTNFRRCRQRIFAPPAGAAAAGEGEVAGGAVEGAVAAAPSEPQYRELPPFCACLDYIMFRPAPSPAAPVLALCGVEPLPSHADVLAAGTLPSATQPSDHVVLGAVFTLSPASSA